MSLIERYIRENDLLVSALMSIATKQEQGLTWGSAVGIANHALRQRYMLIELSENNNRVAKAVKEIEEVKK